jgi:DHA1 family tetracycline resistance protein-like MFS transporter
MQFVCAPVLGNLSDRFGRRPVILVSLLGAGLDYILMAIAPNLAWLFVGRVIAGITGANITAANAYIADVSPPEQRGRNFGLLGACFGFGFVLGPAAGGLLAEFGLRAPFVAAAVLTLCNCLYGFFVLPESLAHDKRRTFSWQRANPLGSLTALRQHPVALGLATTLVLISLAHQTYPATWVLYTTYRFNWSAVENGLSLALVGIMSIVVQGGLTGPIIGKLGEKRALVGGLCVSCIAFALYGLADRGWIVYVVIFAGSIGGVATPAIQSIISKSVSPDEQGAVQGALTSLQSLTGIIGPLLASNLFRYFTSETAFAHVPGAAFFAGALLSLVGTILAVRYLSRHTVPIGNAD